MKECLIGASVGALVVGLINLGAIINERAFKDQAIQAGVAEYRLVTNNSSKVEFVFKQKIVFYKTNEP